MMKMKTPSQLLPCPFCGDDEAAVLYHEKYDLCRVVCLGCGAQTDEWVREENAVHAWNTRHGGRETTLRRIFRILRTFRIFRWIRAKTKTR